MCGERCQQTTKGQEGIWESDDDEWCGHVEKNYIGTTSCNIEAKHPVTNKQNIYHFVRNKTTNVMKQNI
jgi:hypothetical protein